MSNLDQKLSIDNTNVEIVAPKPGGKHATIVKHLRRKKGATDAEVATAIGWQRHSVRGAISAALRGRTRLGLSHWEGRLTLSGRKGRCRSDKITMESDLAALPDQPSDVLKSRWIELYGTAPPSRHGRRIMIRAIAYRLQEQAHGELSAMSRRRLTEAASRAASGQDPATPAIALKPGTRLLREWQGVTHEVIVGEDGITYRDRTWRSLSAVAREITGARWSDPRFFGLRSEKPSNG